MNNTEQASNIKTLVKVLVESGCGSRRQMTDAIKNKRVKINDEIAEAYTVKIDINKDIIKLDEKEITNPKTSYKYIVLNKPVGYLCSTDDPHNDKTVLSLLPQEMNNLYPAGRLDLDSHGLVIMTNDGDLTYRITHPKFKTEKEYRVRIDKPLNTLDRNHFESGVQLDDGLTAPCKVKLDTVSAPLFVYKIIIHEGRNRQIRRMFSTLGYKVIDLERIRVGKVLLNNLENGKYRTLSKYEMESFK